MPTGIVKWYNDAKGFGFIVDDVTKELVLVNKENIANNPKVVFEFENVSYDACPSDQGSVALNIITTRKQDMNFYDHEFTTLNGEQYHMSKYSGRVIIVVNTASHCGLTPDYKNLEAAYQKYKDRGLVVLGFPSANFANQEFNSNDEIKSFCETKYNVTFPVFEKSNVVPVDKEHPERFIDTPPRDVNSFFKLLGEKTGELPFWNFHKYLINKNGTEVISFDPETDVMSEEFQLTIERMLSE